MAIVVTAIALFAIQAHVESILRDADVSLATADLASFERDIVANPGERLDSPAAGLLIYVRAPSGATALNTMPEGLQRSLEHLAAADETVTLAEDGAPYTVVGRVVVTPSGRWSLWAARSSASSALTLRVLDRDLMIGGAALVVVFGLASWLLASSALRPVVRMRRQADSLSGEGNQETLLVGPANDELAALATTLNAFLERVRLSTEREKRMVSDAAHELRTPLAALRTRLELAHDEFGDAQALAREIVAAEESVARLSALATGLLELSQLEGTRLSPSMSTADELVDEAMGSIDRARMLALGRPAEIGFEVDPLDPSARYALGADAFGRLLDNLLSNAIAAVAANGHVELRLADEGEVLRIEVVDDGPGMPSSFLPVAFQRFSRADESRNANSGGSGLGLSIVQGIARVAGGTVELRNGGPGLVVTVRLPKM